MSLYDLITNTDVEIQRIITWILSDHNKGLNECEFFTNKEHFEFVKKWFEANAPEFKVTCNFIDPECIAYITWDRNCSA